MKCKECNWEWKIKVTDYKIDCQKCAGTWKEMYHLSYLKYIYKQ